MPEYRVGADYHQFYLLPFDVLPTFGPHTSELVQVTLDGEGLMVRTNIAMGRITVTIDQVAQAPDRRLAEVLAADWDLGEEVTLNITEGLWLASADPLDVAYEDVIVPTRPGEHIVRVLGRGREPRYYDDVVDDVEEYQMTVWPASP